MTNTEALEALRLRRAELRESMTALEQALAAPASGRSTGWVQRVHVALVELCGDLRDHVALTEGPDGLHGAVVAAAPRLTGQVARLSRDHVRLTAALDDLTDLAAQPGADSAEIRALGTTLLADLARHRQLGSDLVFEAYDVDIGGER